VKPEIDTTKPQAARMYDYFLGGKDNFAADRETAQALMKIVPTIRAAARENRGFLGRAVRYLVQRAGIRQFLDIGTGLPSANNVHEVAQNVAPSCRIVYVDNEPLVLAHARALLTSSSEGKTAYIHADFREPERVLADQATRQTLDFTEPVALMLVAILHFLPDSDDPRRLIQTMLDALPSGSYLVASHVTDEHDPDTLAGAGRAYQERGVVGQIRTSDEFADLVFRGLEMVDPGVVLVSDWRPQGAGPRPLASEVNAYGGIARKP
jgi:SAM-dependent methyltransferase